MIVALTPGPPQSQSVWSGSSRSLLDALERAGLLEGAIDVLPPLADRFEKAASLSRDRQRWRQRFAARASLASPLARRAWTARARKGLAALTQPPRAVLQIGGWCNPTGALPHALFCSYHDGNLATYREHPLFSLDLESAAFRHAWSFERKLYDDLDLIFTMSEWTRQSFVDAFGQPAEKVVTVGAGPNFATLPDPPAGRDFSAPRFLFVGKGDFTRKGGPELLRAFGQVRETLPEAELWLVGPEPGEAQEGVRWFGLISKSTAAGAAEIDRLYREATAFVMPSIYEAFGIVFLEAMAYGLPCVATRACAMPEIVRDGVTGLLAAPQSAERLAQALLALARDAEAARKMGAQGREHLLAAYTWDRVAARMQSEIELRLEQRGGSG